MNWLKILFVLWVLALVGCSGVRVNRDFDPTVDFWALRSYAWIPDAEPIGKDIVVETDSLLHQRVESAVDRELAMKGYRKETTPSRPADFLVNYHIARTRQREVVIYNHYYGYGWGWGRYSYYPVGMGPDTQVREYEENTLVLDIQDPKTRKLMWRATARDEWDDSASPQEKTQIIWNTIQTMLSGFPPLPRSTATPPR
ncbi:MAG: DUF4136 domain-containing protein [Methylococcaceae bacterium]|nr:DUF4136 domain-containing protein [Methylococcaceae bacterium]